MSPAIDREERRKVKEKSRDPKGFRTVLPVGNATQEAQCKAARSY